MTRRAWCWPLAALAALLVAWLALPSALPIYDGLGNPDEPYRYVHPPAGAKATRPPTDAVRTVPLDKNGRNQAAYANTGETGPQLSLYLPAGSLQGPRGASSIRVSATPRAPSPPLPERGTIITNVYRLAAPGATIVGRGTSGTPILQMRAPTAATPEPVFEHLQGGRWVRVATLRVGNDIYQAYAAELGDWALVRLPGTSGSGSGGGINIGLLAAGIAVLALAVLLLVIRSSRARGRAGSGG